MKHWFTIGTRDKFSIDFRLLSTKPGPCGFLTLWIHGQSIGRDDDPVFIYSLLLNFEWILRQTGDFEFSVDIFEVSTQEAWSVLKAYGEKYRISHIEFFDDYLIYAVCNGSFVRFLWTEVNSEKTKPNDAILLKNEIDPIIKEFRLIFDDHVTS